MITLFRMIRLWQLKVKWKLAIMQTLDKQLMELIENKDKLEKKIMYHLAEMIHKSNQEN